MSVIYVEEGLKSVVEVGLVGGGGGSTLTTCNLRIRTARTTPFCLMPSSPSLHSYPAVFVSQYIVDMLTLSQFK